MWWSALLVTFSNGIIDSQKSDGGKKTSIRSSCPSLLPVQNGSCMFSNELLTSFWTVLLKGLQSFLWFSASPFHLSVFWVFLSGPDFIYYSCNATNNNNSNWHFCSVSYLDSETKLKSSGFVKWQLRTYAVNFTCLCILISWFLCIYWHFTKLCLGIVLGLRFFHKHHWVDQSWNGSWTG